MARLWWKDIRQKLQKQETTVESHKKHQEKETMVERHQNTNIRKNGEETMVNLFWKDIYI